MKFKDVVILIFLTGILAYAVCCRSNLIKPSLLSQVENTANQPEVWDDTISLNNFSITADPASGIAVRNPQGDLISFVSTLKPEALRLYEDKVINGDTLDLLYCKITNSDSIPCYRIMEDGRLEGIIL